VGAHGSGIRVVPQQAGLLLDAGAMAAIEDAMAELVATSVIEPAAF